MNRPPLILGLIGLPALLALAIVGRVSIGQAPPTPPDDEQAERLAHSRRILEENCLICHSAELITHGRLTPAQWKSEVTKMMGWGAPVPPEDVDELVGYLAATYGPDRPKVVPDRIDPAAIAADFRQLRDEPGPTDADPDGGRALYATHCATCHGPAALGADLGNNLVLNPVLLRAEDFHTVVLDGRRRMPGFRAVLDEAKAAQIRRYLQTLDAPPAAP